MNKITTPNYSKTTVKGRVGGNRIHDVSLRQAVTKWLKKHRAAHWKGQAACMNMKSEGKCQCCPRGSWGSRRVDVILPRTKWSPVWQLAPTLGRRKRHGTQLNVDILKIYSYNINEGRPVEESLMPSPKTKRSELGKDRCQPPQDPLTPGHREEGLQQHPKWLNWRSQPDLDDRHSHRHI